MYIYWIISALCCLAHLLPQIEELTKKYAELEEKLVELRNLSRAEVTSFLDDEIGSRLDKLSRQVARIDKRLYTYHEVGAVQ